MTETKITRASGMKSRQDSGKPRLAFIFSALLHALVFTGFLLYQAFPPRKLPAVPVFEMVNAEPKLRPVVPKTIEPPPPPEKVETQAPQAPKLTSKPKKVVALPKVEPKVFRPENEEPKPVVEKEVVKPTAEIVTTIVANVPSDPRLSFWAGRVKKRVESLWDPPSGIQVSGRVKTVVSFTVARDGTISAIAIAQSSGNNDLDDMAVRTISRLDQLPPIPPNYPNDALQVSYEFVYQGQ